MLKLLLPVIAIVIGAGAGIGAGVVLLPSGDMPQAQADPAQAKADAHAAKLAAGEVEYLKLNNQFVVPVVEDDVVVALVVMSLSLEVRPGANETVYSHEPKIRDSFLQVLFDHANIGGFHGAFTNAGNMESLRRSLRDVARRDLGEIVSDVLIVDIARQDV